MINSHLQSLFQFGTSAIYLHSSGTTKVCKVFIDTGWRDPISGYDSHPAEIITIFSVLLEDVPDPKIADQIKIDNEMYTVISVHAQDDVIAAIQVRKN